MKVNELLGKSFQEITESDLEIIRNLDESPLLEFKGGEYSSEGNLKRDIIKSVVSFLNGEGEGLIVLGIDEKSRSIRSIDRRIIGRARRSVEARIRDWIVNNLEGVPKIIQPPFIEVKVFEKDYGWVIVVHVLRRQDAVYYSKVDGRVYQRRGNSSVELALNEILTLIESKTQPIIYLLIEPSQLRDSQIHFDVSYMNIGSKPATQLVSNLSIEVISEGIFTDREPVGTDKVPITDVSIKGKHGVIELLKKEANTMSVQINCLVPTRSLPIYPYVRSTVGSFTISIDKDIVHEEAILHIRAIIATFNELNYTIQNSEYIFSGEGIKQKHKVRVVSYSTQSVTYESEWSDKSLTVIYSNSNNHQSRGAVI